MRVESVSVGAERVEAVVLSESAPLRTGEIDGLPERALDLLPGLARHGCRHAGGRRLTDELADTEVAHLFEHVTLELMALSGSPRTLAGETRWDWDHDARGTFHVTLQYDDDVACLGAMKGAAAIVRALVAGDRAPSVDELVSDLRAARARSIESRG